MPSYARGHLERYRTNASVFPTRLSCLLLNLTVYVGFKLQNAELLFNSSTLNAQTSTK